MMRTASDDAKWTILNLKTALDTLYDAARAVDYQDMCSAEERTTSWRQAMNRLRQTIRGAERNRVLTYADLHKLLEKYKGASDDRA